MGLPQERKRLLGLHRLYDRLGLHFFQPHYILDVSYYCKNKKIP